MNILLILFNVIAELIIKKEGINYDFSYNYSVLLDDLLRL